MPEDNQDLLNILKDTERSVTQVAELNRDLRQMHGTPPRELRQCEGNDLAGENSNSCDCDIESDAVDGQEQPENSSSDKNNRDINELQDAYLASLDVKTNELSSCLDKLTNNITTLTESLTAISINVQNLEAEARIKNAEADGKLTDNTLRKEMADKTFGFMEKWCLFVGAVVFIYFAKKDGEPPTEVMLALLGTCTVSIIGLVGFVVSGLFKTGPKKE
ncbi:Uncharacterised protein [Serratia ficaria]|uniref:hypothetical protein n=1 Tax=Serratia ficaria TaxID=61651 RepID=UPI00218423AE|nr:hypothetical protein [Serratia ficaria]CAI2521765.1 Uncharacterised protein [Serratia ficaria]